MDVLLRHTILGEWLRYAGAPQVYHIETRIVDWYGSDDLDVNKVDI